MNTASVQQATNVFVTRGSVMETMTVMITLMKTAPCAVSSNTLLLQSVQCSNVMTLIFKYDWDDISDENSAMCSQK